MAGSSSSTAANAFSRVDMTYNGHHVRGWACGERAEIIVGIVGPSTAAKIFVRLGNSAGGTMSAEASMSRSAAARLADLLVHVAGLRSATTPSSPNGATVVLSEGSIQITNIIPTGDKEIVLDRDRNGLIRGFTERTAI